MNEKYPDSVKNIDIDSICSDQKFGELNFSGAVSSLKLMVQEISELEDYDYKTNLTQSEVNQVDSARNSLIRYIERIKNFSIGAEANPAQVRDTIINEINSFFQNSFASQTRTSLIYLRNKFDPTQTNKKEARNTLTEIRNLKEQIEKQFEKAKEDKENLAQTGSITSAEYLSKEFGKIKDNSRKFSRQWLIATLGVGLTLLVSIFAIYNFFFFKAGFVDVTERIEYGVAAVLFIAIEYFFLKFSVKSFNVYKNIEYQSCHRESVAQTIENMILASGNDPELRSVLIKEGAKAMFETQGSGYLTKNEQGTPISELVANISVPSKYS